jgi:hypothetical protein
MMNHFQVKSFNIVVFSELATDLSYYFVAFEGHQVPFAPTP